MKSTLAHVVSIAACLGLVAAAGPAPAESTRQPQAVQQAVAQAGANQPQLLAALRGVPKSQREGMEFLVENMPAADLQALSSQFLLGDVALAYDAWDKAPWKRAVPKEIFLNDVLPYASLTETRDDWRRSLRDKAAPLVAGCKTPGEAAQRLNAKLFDLVNVHYSTARQRPDQSPFESEASGKASCSGLSILLVDACRSVGVPARVVGTPLWANNRGNHTWVEVWDNGGWHFLGASEPDAQGLDHAWFTGDAAQAKKADPLYAIYATSFQKTGTAFPLVWAPDVAWVQAVNVTDRYAPPAAATTQVGTVRLQVKVVDAAGKRVAAKVTVTGAAKGAGTSKGEAADLNNFLGFDVPSGGKCEVTVEYAGKTVKSEVTAGTGAQQVVVVTLPAAQAARPAARRPFDCAPKPTKAAATARLKKALAAYFMASAAKQASYTFPAALEQMLAADPAAVRAAAWAAYRAAPIHQALKQEFGAQQVKNGQYLSPYTLKVVGTRPAAGWPLVIAMHGGGGGPKEMNDEQWGEMQIYYKDHPEAGGYKYLALRAPNDTWNGFYDDYVYPLVANLVRQQVLFNDVDPNKVFLIGYSHGGYGAFAIGPKEPDLFAAVHASAAAPTDGETTPVTLRNTHFSVMVGTEDNAYGRYDRDQKFAAEVAKLRGDRTDIYPVTVDFEQGRHHSDLPDRDFLPNMFPYVRDAAPTHLTWLMTDAVITDFFWLHTDAPAKAKQIEAVCKANTVTVTTTGGATGSVLLDSRLITYAKPVTLVVNGKTTVLTLKPSLRTLCATMQRRGQPQLAFTSEVALPQ